MTVREFIRRIVRGENRVKPDSIPQGRWNGMCRWYQARWLLNDWIEQDTL